jgi:hypothetical protein
MCYTETLEVISLMLLHRLTKLLLSILAGSATLMYSSIVDAYDDDLQLSLWWLFLQYFLLDYSICKNEQKKLNNNNALSVFRYLDMETFC